VTNRCAAGLLTDALSRGRGVGDGLQLLGSSRENGSLRHELVDQGVVDCGPGLDAGVVVVEVGDLALNAGERLEDVSENEERVHGIP